MSTSRNTTTEPKRLIPDTTATDRQSASPVISTRFATSPRRRSPGATEENNRQNRAPFLGGRGGVQRSRTGSGSMSGTKRPTTPYPAHTNTSQGLKCSWPYLQLVALMPRDASCGAAAVGSEKSVDILSASTLGGSDGRRADKSYGRIPHPSPNQLVKYPWGLIPGVRQEFPLCFFEAFVPTVLTGPRHGTPMTLLTWPLAEDDNRKAPSRKTISTVVESRVNSSLQTYSTGPLSHHVEYFGETYQPGQRAKATRWSVIKTNFGRQSRRCPHRDKKFTR